MSLVATHARERLNVANRWVVHTRRRWTAATAAAAQADASSKWAGLRVAYQVCVSSCRLRTEVKRVSS